MIHTAWRRFRRWAALRPYLGTGLWCPVCERPSRRFQDHRGRRNAMCAHCESLERHRIVWLYVQARTDLFDGQPKRVLHVAPEKCFVQRFQQRLGEGYMTADLASPRAAVKMDVMAIPFADETFDVIYCSHVLEHVSDDRRAMREFHRVLKPDGWAVLLVPIIAKQTIEDPTVVDPQERLKLFGQEDHVRRYGPDYVDRLREAGFDVAQFGVADLFSRDEAARMGIQRYRGFIHHCTRRAA